MSVNLFIIIVFYFPFLGFLLFFCLCPFFLPFTSFVHPGTLFLPLSSSSSFLCGLVGPRPYGLEEDVRQYEQDLAKRLYQARVRATQGAAAPPQPHSSSSASASAASQLRSAPWPQPLRPDARHYGVGWGALVFGVFC